MALNFDLAQRDALNVSHELETYRFNLAKNYALLSGDSAVVRRFYRQTASSFNTGEIYKHSEISRSFFYNARPTNAFVYAGLIPWIVESMVRLVASPGIVANSPLQSNDDFGMALQKDMNNQLQKETKQIKLQDLFEQGVFFETGIGDLLYRISHDAEIDKDRPIIDVIEAPHFELEWKRGRISKIVIKEQTDEIVDGEQKTKINVEMRETYTKTKGGNVKVVYSFHNKNHKITKRESLFEAAQKWWGIGEMSFELPFKDFPLVYKKSSKQSMLYRNERGVPDVHGLDTIEDALSETLSNLVDTIRKSAPKTFVDEELLPSDINGKTAEYSDFDHEYLIVKNTVDVSKLLTVQQARIDYASHLETAKMLISHAINKVGLSPTTLGVTGLESINSSAESQDAREKPSMRTREIKLVGWKATLEELLNKYFQYLAFIKKQPIKDYSDIINISFNEYINPSTENVVSVISQAVSGRVYSVELAVEKRLQHEKKDYTMGDIIAESARIREITPEEEMVLLGLVEKAPQQQTDLPAGSEEDPTANQINSASTALKGEEENGSGNTTNSGTATNDGTSGDE